MTMCFLATRRVPPVSPLSPRVRLYLLLSFEATAPLFHSSTRWLTASLTTTVSPRHALFTHTLATPSLNASSPGPKATTTQIHLKRIKSNSTPAPLVLSLDLNKETLRTSSLPSEGHKRTELTQ